jgi:hypothetical protein
MASARPDQSHDLPRLGVPAKRPLGEHQPAVHGHLEHPAGGGDEADVAVGKLLPELSRQTGGSRLVVSDDAVFDDGVHDTPGGLLRDVGES